MSLTASRATLVTGEQLGFIELRHDRDTHRACTMVPIDTFADFLRQAKAGAFDHLLDAPVLPTCDCIGDVYCDNFPGTEVDDRVSA